jgi:hypothetical protein
MRAILSPDDLKRGELIDPPGWTPMEITRYEEKEADTDKSTNCIFHFMVIDGPNRGRQATKLFNEKALGFGKNLWKTLGFPFDPEKGYELSTELFQQAVGAKMKCYVKRGKSNKGNDFNDITDFMPLS